MVLERLKHEAPVAGAAVARWDGAESAHELLARIEAELGHQPPALLTPAR